MIKPFKFSSGVNVPVEPPEPPAWVTNAISGRELNDLEKYEIVRGLYVVGNSTPTFKVAGWGWHLSSVLNRFLVNYDFSRNWLEFYAPDETSLQKVLEETIFDEADIEIVAAPKKKKAGE